MEEKTIMIVAGEASGDLHGSRLVKAMKEEESGLRFFGIGGKRSREAGVSIIADVADMAVVGLTEVVLKLFDILKVMREMKKRLRQERPNLLILIDYPDFNIPLAKTAKELGIPVLYYISPQVWAWRFGRIKTIRRCVNKMLVILPFEEALYRSAGVDARYVGHPLLDAVNDIGPREEILKRLGLDPGKKTVAILPGSRRSEVVKLLPVMLGAAEIISGGPEPVQFLLPLASTLDAASVEQIIGRHRVPVKIVPENIYDAIASADVAMVASGTATLETALLNTPMVIIYKMSPLTYAIARMIIRVKNIGLVNIIAGKTIVPELIQGEATSERLAAEMNAILADPAKMETIKNDLGNIREKLGKPGAAARAAAIALGMMSQKERPSA
ncbi:MAG: lipid-A-disaccharide synthase [Deltaproteobacteria bacterium]|nr:lipid-A-disaccharide synthase [Deltaproteobacteria bacterium]